MIRWEYKEVAIRWEGYESICNKLGQDGWELVSITTASGDTKTFVFKRPIQ